MKRTNKPAPPTAARKRAEDLVALIGRRKQRITEDFYDLGEALRDLARPENYKALGYATFDALLDGRRLLGRTQVFKLIHVATSFTRQQALDLGLEKAFAIVTYAAATPAHDVPRFVLDTGTIDGRPIASLSVRDIDAAARKVRASSHRARATPEEKRAATAARAWQAELRKRGAHGAVVTVLHAHGALWLDARVPAASREAKRE